MAVSTAKTRANQRNAQRSTGPRTTEGKANSRLNAIKHGVLSSVVVAPNEDPDAFDGMFLALKDDLQPHGPIEDMLVEKIAINLWRSRRLAIVDRLSCEMDHEEVTSRLAANKHESVFRITNFLLEKLGLVCRYETTLNNQLFKLMEALKQEQERRTTIDGEVEVVKPDASHSHSTLALSGPSKPTNDNSDAA